MPRPQLSLCMIVRDEAAMLPDFLAAVSGLWDELVAVDTGSTDETVELLENAGARVHRFSWRDDFAAARNASLEAATGRWILFLDADERVAPGFHAELGRLLANPRAGAATLRMRNALPDGSYREADLLRLFRNDPAIRFRHRIHEDPSDDVAAYLERTDLALLHLESPVEHLGYVREVAVSRNKKDRDLALLSAMVEDDPADLYGWFKILELARFWADAELWSTTAIDAAGRFENADPNFLSRSRWSGELAVLIAQGLGFGPDDGLAWLEEHADRTRRSAAWWMRRGLWSEALGRNADAAHAYQACLESEPDRAGPLNSLRPRLGLSRLAAADGRLQEAWSLASVTVELAPADPEALTALIGFGKLARCHPDSIEVLTRIGAERPELVPAMADTLLQIGEAEAALEILLPAAESDPDLAVGAIVCALACARQIDLALDVDQEVADALLKAWINKLWAGANPRLKEGFAERAGVVSEAFPWLGEYLAEIAGHTALISSSRR